MSDSDRLFWKGFGAALMALCFVFPVDVQAQSDSPGTAFESLRISGSAGKTFQTRNLDAWNNGYGLAVGVSTPFYYGELEVEVSYADWMATEPDLPDFRAFLGQAGWMVSTSSKTQVQASAGLRMGIYFMAFDSEQVSGERNESEFAITPFVRLRRTLYGGTNGSTGRTGAGRTGTGGTGIGGTGAGRIEGFVELAGSRVFTRPNLDLLQVSGGISIQIKSPSWLKDLLE